MLNVFYVTFLSNVSDSLYNDLNKTSYIWTNSFPPSNWTASMKLLLSIVFSKIHMISRENIVNMAQKPDHYDWSLITEQWIESMDLGECPSVTLPYKELISMNELYHAINWRISAHKNCPFKFHYSVEQGKIYIGSPMDNINWLLSMVIINDSLRDVLGFKQNIPAAVDFAFSTLHETGSGEDLKKVFRKIPSSMDNPLRAIEISSKGKRSRNTLSLISLYLGQKQKTSLLSKKKKPRNKFVRSKKGFFS